MRRKNPKPDDLVKNPAQARRARSGLNCPACGRWKSRGAMFCHDCNRELTQQQRNQAGTDIEKYIEIARDLRTQHAAADLGLKVL